MTEMPLVSASFRVTNIPKRKKCIFSEHSEIKSGNGFNIYEAVQVKAATSVSLSVERNEENIVPLDFSIVFHDPLS